MMVDPKAGQERAVVGSFPKAGGPGQGLTHLDNVVLGEAIGDVLNVAPVGGLPAGDLHVRRSDLQGLQVSRQWRGTDLRLQQLHPLQTLVGDGREVDRLERRDRSLQDPIHKVHSPILEEKAENGPESGS